MKAANQHRVSPSASSVDLVITVLAIILAAGTMVLPFAQGAITGNAASNEIGSNGSDAVFTIAGATNLSPPPASWPGLDQSTYAPSAMAAYPFVDPVAGPNWPQQFDGVLWP